MFKLYQQQLKQANHKYCKQIISYLADDMIEDDGTDKHEVYD